MHKGDVESVKKCPNCSRQGLLQTTKGHMLKYGCKCGYRWQTVDIKSLVQAQKPKAESRPKMKFKPQKGLLRQLLT